MKPVFPSIEALFETGGVTGEVVMDEVLRALVEHRDVIRPEELARVMDADVRDLRGAVRLLTGMRLRDVITQWRVLEARLMMERGVLRPDEVAQHCGWRSLRSMKAVLRRRGQWSARSAEGAEGG